MGGNVFKGKTDRIKRDDITTTLDNYFNELGRLFPKKKDIFKYFKPVGSVGKKDTSGDIDLAIDVSTILDKNFSDESIKEWGVEPQIIKDNFIKLKTRSRTATDSQLMLKAFLLELVKVINSKSPNIFCDEKKVTPGNIFSLYPQFDGTTKKKLDIGVQIDWMIGDLDWLEFSYYSEEYKGNVKGLHRTQLMLSMFTNKGLIFNHAGGVKDKETNTIIATKPSEAIDKLNELYKFKLTKSILENYFTLRTFLEKNLDKSEYDSIIGIYLRILDSTRCDIPEDLQNTWKARKTELQLTGKYLPDDSNLLKESYKSFKDLILN